jgi:hypothetical protein
LGFCSRVVTPFTATSMMTGVIAHPPLFVPSGLGGPDAQH